MKNTILTIVGLLCIVVLGCRTFVDRFTPVRIRQPVRELAGVEPNDFGMFGPMLTDAEDIKNKLIVQHRRLTLAHSRAAEDIDWEYNFAFGLLDFDMQDAREGQQIVIGSTENPFSILGIMAGLGLGGIGTAIGKRYLKSPREKEQEHEIEVLKAENNKANGKE